MLTFLDRLHKIRDTKAPRSESGAALIFAVIVMMVMLLTITLVTTSAITAINSTTTQSIEQLKREAAETGIQSALMAANGETTTPTQSIFERSYASGGWYNGDLRNVVVGEPSIDARYRWRAEPVVEYGGRLSWYVHAQGYVAGESPDDTGHKIQALVRGLEVESGGTSVAGGTGINYSATRLNPWQVAPLFGELSVAFNPGVTVRSYDSWNGYNPQLQADQRAVVGTNSEFSLLAGAPMPGGITEFSVPQYQAGVSCVPQATAGCTSTKFSNRGFSYQNSTIVTALGDACPATSYPAWTASTSGGVLDLSGNTPKCFSSLDFNQNTTVLGKAPVYVTGNTTVQPGVKVNVGNDPSSLRIMSASGNLTTGSTSATPDTGTVANFYYASDAGVCQLRGTFSGAASCLRVTALQDATLYLDMAAGTKFVARGTSADMNLWHEVSTQRR